MASEMKGDPKDAGCKGCDKETEKNIEKKDPDDWTEQEQAILDGEEEMPRFKGPLSSVNVDYCSFCHGVGQLGAIVFGAIGGGTASNFGLGSPAVIELAIWVLLAVVVGYVGHFPILGPMVGPIVERFLATFASIRRRKRSGNMDNKQSQMGVQQ